MRRRIFRCMLCDKVLLMIDGKKIVINDDTDIYVCADCEEKPDEEKLQEIRDYYTEPELTLSDICDVVCAETAEDQKEGCRECSVCQYVFAETVKRLKEQLL